jgi:hypothetical protein
VAATLRGGEVVVLGSCPAPALLLGAATVAAAEPWRGVPLTPGLRGAEGGGGGGGGGLR